MKQAKAAKARYERLKHEMRTEKKTEKLKSKKKKTSKPFELRLMVIEPCQLTMHPLIITDDTEFKIKHNGKLLTFQRDALMQKTFAEMNWHGGIKHLFVFCKLTEKGSPDLIGLKEFDPYSMISSEEADIMLHEGVTVKGVKHLVTKVSGVSGSTRIWLLLGVVLIVVIALVMKSQGMIG